MRSRSILVVGLSLFVASVASALQPIPEYLPKILTGADQKAYVETLNASTMKCSSCHTPGADKKAKGHGLNDFGQAIHKVFDHKKFNAAHKADNKEEAGKLLKDAWEKAAAEKNSEGVVFAELIKQGKLPGTNPAK